jgi:hypothetical protein
MEWKNNIKKFESPAHEENWNEIEKNIAKEAISMYHIEVAPPESCWESISETLNKKKKKQPISIRMRYAAIFIGILLISAATINTSFRDSILNALNGANIKAALPNANDYLNQPNSKDTSAEQNIKYQDSTPSTPK